LFVNNIKTQERKMDRLTDRRTFDTTSIALHCDNKIIMALP